MRRREFLAAGAAMLTVPLSRLGTAATERHLLYIAAPGIRNYVSYGGVGILVYDIGEGYKFVKRIPTWGVSSGQEPENVKGVEASARTGKLYVSTMKRLGCIDLVSEKMVWERELEGGCDRMALSPDGRVLYVPSFEGPHWNVVDAGTGDTITKIVTDSAAHNTVYSSMAGACISPGCAHRSFRSPIRRPTSSSQPWDRLRIRFARLRSMPRRPSAT